MNPPSLSPPGPKRPSYLPVLLVCFVGILLLAAPAWLYFHPRQYLAQVTLGIEPTRYYTSESRPLDETIAHLKTLRRPEVLGRVVEQLELVKKYSSEAPPVGADEARERLWSSLQVQVLVEEPRVAVIGAYDHDPVMAANIANMVALTFRNALVAELELGFDRSLNQFADELLKAKHVAVEAAKELERVRVRDEITDADAARIEATVTGRDIAAYMTAKTSAIRSQLIFSNAEKTLARARGERTNFGPLVRIRQKALPPAAPLPWWRARQQASPDKITVF